MKTGVKHKFRSFDQALKEFSHKVSPFRAGSQPQSLPSRLNIQSSPNNEQFFDNPVYHLLYLCEQYPTISQILQMNTLQNPPVPSAATIGAVLAPSLASSSAANLLSLNSFPSHLGT
jgi:hypothetical protein